MYFQIVSSTIVLILYSSNLYPLTTGHGCHASAEEDMSFPHDAGQGPLHCFGQGYHVGRDNVPDLSWGLMRPHVFLLLLLNPCHLTGCAPQASSSWWGWMEGRWESAKASWPRTAAQSRAAPENPRTHEQNTFLRLYSTTSLRLFIMQQKAMDARAKRWIRLL